MNVYRKDMEAIAFNVVIIKDKIPYFPIPVGCMGV